MKDYVPSAEERFIVVTAIDVNGWPPGFTLPSGQTITSGWNVRSASASRPTTPGEPLDPY
jgi:hypothetical protein